MKSNWQTRITLIERAKSQDNEEAWNDFVVYYERFIKFLLSTMRVPIDDSDDLVQNILIKLWKKLATYEAKKAKFRTWLSTIIRNETISYFRNKNALKNSSIISCEDLEYFNSFEESDLDKKIEQEWKSYLSRIALERVEQAYRGQAFEVFQLSLKGHSQEEIINITGLSSSSVYTLKSRVKNTFVKEIKQLIDALEF